jgi:ubiquitin-conjugating enzyme E2 H
MDKANKRKDKDVMKLLVSEYEVHLANENSNSEFLVKFSGPKDSPYEGVSPHRLTRFRASGEFA